MAKTKKTNLEERISELERRVEDLEKRPYIHPYTPPTPFPPYAPYTPYPQPNTVYYGQNT